MLHNTHRTLILSNRNFELDVFRCGQVELENIICAIDDVDLIAPRASLPPAAFALRGLGRLTRRAIGVELSYQPQLEKVRLRRDYDLLFVYAQGLADLAVLEAVPGWRKRCATAVCFVEEAWAQTLPRWGRRTFDTLAQFDLLSCAQRGSVEALGRLAGRRCEWLPGGIDALTFHPGLRPPPRTIDVYAMGRRSERSHRALLDHATLHGWTYLFDTIDVRHVRDGDHMQHRRQLAELVKRSRYFLANRGRVDRSDDTGGQEEVGFRSLEGAAGGAVLIGDAPRGPHVDAMFGWPDAHIHVPFGSTEIAEVITALDREPERVARIRRDNVVNSLRMHDWAYRYRRVLEWVDLAPSDRLTRRLRELEELAVRTEQGDTRARPGKAAAADQ